MTQNDDEVLGANIRAARMDRGISQAELAERMQARGHSNWRQTTTSRVERGKQTLRVSEVIALEEMLGPISAGTGLGRMVDMGTGMNAAVRAMMNQESPMQKAMRQMNEPTMMQKAVEQMKAFDEKSKRIANLGSSLVGSTSFHQAIEERANSDEMKLLRRIGKLEDALEAALVELRAMRSDAEAMFDDE